ncbi:hypothetical protein K431DRAFT_229835 [Polychaeton citri CBS 116435]|uniref:Glutamate--tRNA ligase, mitochondrial n=1 Tax=Polychaeton citri CBS 116435 TaxID=1314669 RepID=A0A9P4UN09_9PEZI|nr:hypothetical protein K431DRAFT_229835 [Polychaeton citri CBS 116435]
MQRGALAFTTRNPTSRRRPLRGHILLANSRPSLRSRSFATSSKNRDASELDASRRVNLPDSPARTRFAPSPTGFMHIGGLRTALFSYLLAKRTGGQFLLRIEDTDQKRLVQGAEQRIFDDLQWAGLQWDEGPGVGGPYGSYKQSERNDIYQKHAQHLLDSGTAYRCFCTSQTAGAAASLAYVTSGCYQSCSSLTHDESQTKAKEKHEPFTVRLVQPKDVHKRVYKDLIYGKIKRLKRSPSASSSASVEDGAGSSLDLADTILIKSDGTPTYHFANVVDDHLMQITHVIRGTEWMASTPLHYDLYTAFGWEPPEFAHVGLLLDKDKAKLSKRNADLQLDVFSLRGAEGVLPETLINFLVLLGWSNPQESDVLQLQDMIEIFDLKFTTGNTVCDTKKLWFLQKQHVQRRCLDARQQRESSHISGIVERIQKTVLEVYSSDLLVGRAQIAHQNGTMRQYCEELLLLDDKNYQTPKQWVERNNYFFTYNTSQVPESKDFVLDEPKVTLSDVQEAVKGALSEWSENLGSRPDTLDHPPPKLGAVPDGKDANSTHFLLPAELENAVIHDALHKSISELSTNRVRGLQQKMSDPEDDMDQVGVDSAMVQTAYKACNKTAMRWLRDRLCYGKPGPGMGAVIATLGWSECARRLGISTLDQSIALTANTQ